MLGKEAQILPEPSSNHVRELYDKYSGMLFGYIFEVVKDAKLAEKYLVDFYTDIPNHIHEINAGGTNTWCQLQRLVKRYLSNLFSEQSNTNSTDAVADNGNRFLSVMTEDQRLVFYGIHYGGKSAVELSRTLNKPEEFIRKSLKEAFTILRQQK